MKSRTIAFAVLLTAVVILLLNKAGIIQRSFAQNATGSVTTVSAASYARIIAPEEIAAAFGVNLAADVSLGQDFDPSAPGVQLPTLLGGISLEVNGRSAGMFFVSPTQINFQVPPDLEPGTGSVIVRTDKGAIIASGEIEIRPNAPSIFTADASGQGVPAGVLFRLKANGAQSFEPIARLDQGTGRLVPIPLDLGPPGERVFLILYLTGARRVAKASDTRLLIGGAEFIPAFIGAQPDFVGVEQLNFELPRTLKGRLSFVLSAIGFPTSNVCEIEIAPPNDLSVPNAAPPNISSLTVAPAGALAGETIEVAGSGFSAHPSEVPEVLIADNNQTLFNAQVVEASATRTRIIVPFGAGSGKLIMRNPRGESSIPFTMRTSVSGNIQTAQLQANGQILRVGLPNVTVRAFTANGVIERKTNNDGVFLLTDVPPASRMSLEIDGTTTGLPYPNPLISIRVNAGRDNQFQGYLELKQATGTTVPTISAGVLPETAFSAPASATPEENELTGQTGQVVFEPNGSTVRLPDGTPVNELKVTVLDPGRTPVDLPESHFSTTIVQLTPFGARITPGGKLTFPNTDSLPASSTATLFRYDQTAGSATLGQFVSAGSATVTADGLRVETARDAIKEATYYFISVARTTTTIYGSVVEEDDTPARGALVQVRGKSVFALTDDNGAFILTNVPVLGSEQLTLEVSYLRPDGTVDRTERAGIRPGGSALTFVSPPIVLTGRGRTRAPAILAPRFLTIEAGKPADFNFIAFARGTQTSLRSVTVAGASFASVNALGGDRYNLRLAPGTSVTGNFTLTVTARDSQDASTTEAVIVEVKAADTNQPIANSQSLITNEDSPLALTLQGSGGTVYRIVSFPRRGSLSGTAPNLVYTPEPNYNGADSFSFTVSNGTTTSSAAVVTLAIRLADDAPRLDVGAVFTTNIGTPLNVVINGFDVDAGQRLTLAATGLPAGAAIVQTTGTSWVLRWVPKFDQIGSFTVNLLLRDDGSPVLNDSRAITVRVDAKWAATSQLGAGTINSFTSLGDILFAATAGGGVYRTTDKGVSWAAVNNGLVNLSVSALTVKDAALFAGASNNGGGGGVYRSTDKGASWIAVNNRLGNLDVRTLIGKGNALFAGTFGGVYRTTDNGMSWTAVNNGLGNLNVQTFAIKENTLFVATFSGGVYRTTDDGASWRAVNNGLGNLSVLSLAVKDNALFAGLNGTGGVYRTTDDGANWIAVNNGLGAQFVPALVVKDNALFAGTGSGGVYRTTNDGANWAAVNNGLASRSVRALAVNESMLFASTDGDVIYRTIDNGANWTAVNSGLGDLTANTLAVKGDLLFAGTSVQVFSRGGVSRTTNNGTNWMAINNGLMNQAVLSLAVKENALFAGTFGVYRTTNDGVSWTAVNNGLSNNFVQALAVKDAALFAGTSSGGVYRTTNDGLSWTAVNNGLGNLGVRSLVVKENALFAGTGGGGIYRTTDNGASWTQVNNGLGNQFVQALAVRENALFAGTGAGVYQTTDNGASWTAINNGLGLLTVLALTVKEDALFAGTFSRGVYRMTGNVANWTTVNNGLNNRVVRVLTVKGNALIAGTDAGVFLLAESATTWAESNTGLGNRNVNAAIFSGDAFLVGTFGSGVFRSTDKGQGWSPTNTGLPPAADVRAFTPSGNGVLAGLAGEGVYFSNDQGRNWVARNAGLTNKLVNALAGDGATVYAGTNGGVFRSGDGGANWTMVNSGLTRLQVLSLAISGGEVYAGTDNGLFRSTNQGASWTEVSAGLTDRYIVSLGVAPNGTTLLAGTSSGLFRSTNQGQNWTPVTSGVPERVVALTFVQKGTKLLMGSVNGFFVSEDNGASFRQINGGLLTLQVGALAVSGDTVLAGTRSGGVFVSQLP